MAIVEEREDRVVDPSGGANQIRVRAYNERLVLSIVRRHRSLPKSEIARRSGLSPQTVSVIMRSLEDDGLLIRGEPQRGKVGQPSIPMSLDPDGAYSIGLKIGRRSADLVLLDFLGRERHSLRKNYKYPLPDQILEFVSSSLNTVMRELTPQQRKRIGGIGIATPFELWNWAEKIGAPQDLMDDWRGFDFRNEVETLTGLPTFIQNDATSACGAELVFGRGSELTDFLYFFVGTFIGGGIVLNQSIYSGRTGNAGALGPMPIVTDDGTPAQLLDYTSIFTLESMLQQKGMDPSAAWLLPDDWSSLEPVLQEWINQSSKYLAFAITSACSLIDFEAVIIDGALPLDVRDRIVSATANELEKLDTRGIDLPEILSGTVGKNSRAMGGASLPLFDRYLLDPNVLFKEMN